MQNVLADEFNQITEYLSMNHLQDTEKTPGHFFPFSGPPVKIDWIITNKQGVNKWRVLHTRQYSTPIEYR